MIVLEPSSPNYKWWRDLVLLTLHRYALDDHIPSDITDPPTYWARLYIIMVTWILNTLSPELHEVVREPTETAHQEWLALEAQFLDNRKSLILQLNSRFCVFKQDDFSISDNYHRMKGMADDLRAMGETINTHRLILNLLQA
jgi:hypothetical protein